MDKTVTLKKSKESIIDYKFSEDIVIAAIQFLNPEYEISPEDTGELLIQKFESLYDIDSELTIKEFNRQFFLGRGNPNKVPEFIKTVYEHSLLRAMKIADVIVSKGTRTDLDYFETLAEVIGQLIMETYEVLELGKAQNPYDTVTTRTYHEVERSDKRNDPIILKSGSSEINLQELTEFVTRIVGYAVWKNINPDAVIQLFIGKYYFNFPLSKLGERFNLSVGMVSHYLRRVKKLAEEYQTLIKD